MEEQIAIDLLESSNAKSFEKSKLIHIKEFDKAKNWIDEKIEKQRKSESAERFHDTITILGSRGSGKTTFLLSLLNHYKTERKEVEVIDLIDPTLIEEKGHIFLLLISQIAEVVNEKLLACDCDTQSPTYLKKSKWRELLKRLSAGIPSIDGVGANFDSWQDAEFIMDKGLKSVKSAKNLEQDFHNLVEYALEILDRKVFIIALDDIDIDFRKGFPVLETIRKYLTTPYIITLLSGDLKLFSKAIRKQQWSNFGKALLKNEGELLGKITEYNDLVTEMEGQYLQKVMKPQKRIHLTTLKEKLSSDTDIKITVGEENDPILFFYRKIFKQFGINNSYQSEPYSSFLLGLPIRTQIQFLSEFIDFPKGYLLQANVIDPFLSDLYEKRVNIDVAKSNPKFLNAIILELLIQEKVLDEAYQLQPSTTDISLNACLMSLTFLFGQKIEKNPFLIFDYLTRIGYVRNLLSVLGYQDDSTKIVSFSTPSIEGLCKHAAIMQDRGARDIVCYITAYIRAFLNYSENAKGGAKKNSRPWGGTIPLSGFAFKAKKGSMDNKDRIDYMFRNKTLFEQQIAYIPLSVSQPNNKQQSLPTYSIYALLGAIAELIRISKDANEELNKGISQLSQVRSYPMPNFENFTADNSELNNVFETKASTAPGPDLGAMIKIWINKYNKEEIIPVYLLGKISTRLFYALRIIESMGSDENLGKAMHRRIIILLNSILLEDSRENIREVRLSNNNPNLKDDIFIDNLDLCNKLEYTKETDQKLKFSRWMLSCPLFLLYLDYSQELKQSLYPFISDFVVEEEWKTFTEYSIYKLLANVDCETKKPIFYYGQENVKSTIEIVKKIIEYTTLLENDINEVIAKCQDAFSNKIEIKSMISFRNYLTENSNIKW